MSGQPCFLHTCFGLRFLASEATDPEHGDASVLVLCFLMHQNSWLTSWRFSQKLKNLEKFKFEIHGALPDACIIDTCFETNEQKKVTCFVMNADNLTMHCREGDVEANDNLQRQFTPSCKVSKVSFEICCCICLPPCPRLQHFLFVLRTIVVYSCLELCPYLERCPCLSLKRALVGGRRFRPSAAVVCGCRFPLSCRVDSRLVTMSHSL